jgi:ATP-dependent helicase/DNAse subunit B
VLNLRLEDEVGESLDRGQFGDLVHRTLEGIDREMADSQQATTKDDLEKWIPQLAERVRAEFINAYPDYNLESGQNHLLYKVAVRMIGNFFAEQIKGDLFPMEILGLEKELTADYQTFVRGEAVHVRLTGKIDRVDRIGSQIRIIDYKTGKIEKKQLKSTGPEQEDLLLANPEGDKIRQLWLYKYIVAKKMVQDNGIKLEDKHLALDQHQLVAGIFSFRNLKEGLLEEHLDIGEGTLESFVKHSEDYLNKLIQQLLNAEQPFERTTNVKICTRCDYRTVCGR